MDIINEKVTFVISNCRCVEGYRQAYLVGDNKTSLDTAKRWASHGKCCEIIEDNYEVYETFNKDFTLKIFEESQTSSQGGKLSFWNCIIQKEDKTFMLGIQAHSLCELIKSTTCINGEIQDSVSFYRNSSDVLVALTDSITFHDKTAKKTNKWEVGKVYSNKSIDDICLGKVRFPFDYDYYTSTFSIDFNRFKLAYHELHSLIHVMETADDNIPLRYNIYDKCPSRYCTDDYGMEFVDKVHAYINKCIDSDIKDIKNDIATESQSTYSYMLYRITNILTNFDVSKADKIINVLNDIINFAKTRRRDYISARRHDTVMYHVNLIDYNTKKVTKYDYDNYYKAIICAYEWIIEQINKIKNGKDE